jgi:TPR repeat protein
MVLNDPPEPLGELSEAQNAALLKALAKKSEDRYPDCVSFVRTLVEAERSNIRWTLAKMKRLVNAKDFDGAMGVFERGIESNIGENTKETEIEQASNEVRLLFFTMAESGYAPAQGIRGAMLEDDDRAQAAEWYRKAAEQGNADAQFALGMMYITGRSCVSTTNGPEEDIVQALKWIHKSAEQGNADALNQLGNIYYNGKRGVKKDYSQAFEWIRKAAEREISSSALKLLGDMYAEGKGVAKDPGQAKKWYRKAEIKAIFEI